MIFAVDDEQRELELVSNALRLDGHQVATFTAAAAALAHIERDEVELLIADVMMPTMTGFELQQAVRARLGERAPAFIFLSSLNDAGSIVRGLDAGADDFLSKPVDPLVLRAKVRAVLARRSRPAVSVFRGELARFPFVKILQFCELQGLNGEVVFTADGDTITVPFKAGSVRLDELADADETLTRLYDLAEGDFELRARSVDFAGLAAASPATASTLPSPATAGGRPKGRLSGIRVNERTFQIQTELVSFPEPQVVTVVILDGATVLKRAAAAPPASERAELERLIEGQHAAVEQEVRERIEAKARAKAELAAPAREEFYQLFERGFEAYRRRELAEALALWERARELNPSDTTLAINLRIVRAKLAGDDPGRRSGERR